MHKKMSKKKKEKAHDECGKVANDASKKFDSNNFFLDLRLEGILLLTESKYFFCSH